MSELEKLKYQGKELERCSESMAEKNISVIPHLEKQNDRIIKLTFDLASNLFQKNVTNSKWDTKVLQAVLELLRPEHTGISDPSPPIDLIKGVHAHFTQLEDLLSHENFSMCAWETVRMQVRITLHRFLIRLRQLRARNQGKKE
ncbi:interferon beta-like [Alosa alosa]|nr:interferon beta-like isoform X2 [Alosa sapidissima]XP_041943834.1 interferon beta-like isoform X2 [Alosa sapidissima]XP_041943835.1 interferon beta-like [Alosa sapidissima]XP_041943836.1 interferon beta-like [Alosa sapidissima]XP_048100913.1 interferon beta-like [Alosa alosa]XP_048102445.1 interferon beta-like [Alosa alosa]